MDVQVSINGTDHSVVLGISITKLLDELCISSKGSAIAIGNEIIPREQWDSYRIESAVSISVFKARSLSVSFILSVCSPVNRHSSPRPKQVTAMV